MTTTRETGRHGIAAFDFDGTLTRRSTFVPFLRAVAGTPAVLAAFAFAIPKLVRALLADSRRDAAKVAVLRRLLRGRDPAELREIGERFADDVVAHRLRPDGLERLAWHRAQGHDLLIVSASPSVYLDAVGVRLGMTAVLATELEVASDGRLTGAMAGPNVRRGEKVRRVEAWIADSQTRGRDVETWAYGDSTGDRELLAWADHPVKC